MKRGLVYLFVLIYTTCLGQTDYRFKNYTINEGLSQSLVSCIIQDDLYSLWIGTQDGLNRFDGTDFEVFNSNNTKGITNEYIRSVAKTSNGDLWFGTNNGLLKYSMSTEEFTSFPGPALLQVQDLIIDGNIIWVGTAENGLYKFDTSKKEYSSLRSKVKGKYISDLFLTDEKELFVFSEDYGLAQFNIVDQTTQKIELPTGIKVNKILPDNDKSVLLATTSGVYSLDLSSGSTRKTFTDLRSDVGDLNVADLYYNNDLGWLIATHNDGLYTYSNNGKIQHSLSDAFQKYALLFDDLYTIYKDNTGVFWIGSQRGLSSFDPSYEGFFGISVSGNEEKGLPSSSVWSITEDTGGKYLYVGTDREVSRFNRTTGTFQQYPRGTKFGSGRRGEQTVLSLKVVNNNLVLVGCADGLFKLSIGEEGYNYEKVEFKSNEAQEHERIYRIVKYSQEKYFLATNAGAILYDVRTGAKQYFSHDRENPNGTIMNGICRLVYKDPSNTFWFATSSGGLSVLEENDGKLSIVPFKGNTKLQALTSATITDIHTSKNGGLWMGTLGSGLLYWDVQNNTGKVISKKEGMPNSVVYGVLEDSVGNIWMSTNKGLASFNPTNNHIRSYRKEDGLFGDEFNLGASLGASNGVFYFGGIYGLNFFDPLHLETERKNVDVVFSRFKLENEWLKPGDEKSPLKEPVYQAREIHLPYGSRSFTIKFQPSVLNSAEKVNYKYILVGSDEGEILLGRTKEIRFNALSPGSYELKVYARLGDGPWSQQPAIISIYVASPFWSSWWFILICILVVAIAIRLFIKQRIDSARREQIRLEMKIRERTKEIQHQKQKIEDQKKRIEEEKEKVERQQVLLKREKDKTEKLLKNIIPESTAEELKKKGKARARAYKTVSVLFTDFVGFTKISDQMNPTELVRKLDVYFTKFDDIIVRNNLEKIKTIGDAYMCAGGVPVRNNTNPIDTCLAAIQIQHYMETRKMDAIANGKDFWECRLGINTGEVTAGVIGSERLAYDIWGATVNQAQRMEMLGDPGEVTVTGMTYQHIEPYFECTFKGKAQSKSRGLIDMYVVERIKPELSKDGEGIYPNKRFHQIVNLHHYSSINYYKAERHIMQLLERHLGKDLHYHSIDHTKDVVKAVERIALLENVTDEGLFLLKSAATYHDAGFIEQYEKNEPIGARLAEEILPKYGYTEKHIDRIKELIYVTMIPHKPKSQLEEIICDADLDYLGRDDFHEISNKLKRELMEHGKIGSDREWDEIQVKFLKSHRYFTQTAIDTRVKKKKENLKEVEERLKRNEY